MTCRPDGLPLSRTLDQMLRGRHATGGRRYCWSRDIRAVAPWIEDDADRLPANLDGGDDLLGDAVEDGDAIGGKHRDEHLLSGRVDGDSGREPAGRDRTIGQRKGQRDNREIDPEGDGDQQGQSSHPMLAHSSQRAGIARAGRRRVLRTSASCGLKGDNGAP